MGRARLYIVQCCSDSRYFPCKRPCGPVFAPPVTSPIGERRCASVGPVDHPGAQSGPPRLVTLTYSSSAAHICHGTAHPCARHIHILHEQVIEHYSVSSVTLLYRSVVLRNKIVVSSDTNPSSMLRAPVDIRARERGSESMSLKRDGVRMEKLNTSPK